MPVSRWRRLNVDSTWRVEFDAVTRSDLLELDRVVQRRIVHFLRTRIAGADSPRRFGKPLRGPHPGLGRYRVGDYRLIVLPYLNERQ